MQRWQILCEGLVKSLLVKPYLSCYYVSTFSKSLKNTVEQNFEFSHTGATSTVWFRCLYCELWVHHSTSLIFNFVLILFVACPCSATSREPSSRRNDCPWCRIREWLPHCMHGLYGKSGYIWVLVCEINLIHLKQMFPFYILSKYQENSISLMFWRVIWIKGHKVFKNGPSKI